MKIFYLLLINGATMLACTTSSPEILGQDPRDHTYILSMYVGSKNSKHDGKFEAKAKDVCGGDFSVLEKYYSSSTMQDVSGDDYSLTWRIQCQQ